MTCPVCQDTGRLGQNIPCPRRCPAAVAMDPLGPSNGALLAARLNALLWNVSEKEGWQVAHDLLQHPGWEELLPGIASHWETRLMSGNQSVQDLHAIATADTREAAELAGQTMYDDTWGDEDNDGWWEVAGPFYGRAASGRVDY